MTTFEHDTNNQGGTFFILDNNQKAGEITYVWAGDDKFIIDHTQVYEDHSGKGYGRMLVKKAIEYAKSEGVKILPLCPYARKVMEGEERLKKMIFR